MDINGNQSEYLTNPFAGKLKVQDLETSSDISLNGELQKINNLTSSSTNITNITGSLSINGFDALTTATPVGDLSGPSSTVDGNIARYDGTTGKVVQDSSFNISDTGVLTGSLIVANSIYPSTGIGVLKLNGGLLGAAENTNVILTEYDVNIKGDSNVTIQSVDSTYIIADECEIQCGSTQLVTNTSSITLNSPLIETTGNIVPNATNTKDIGSGTKKYKDIHSTRIFTNTVQSSGNMDISANELDIVSADALRIECAYGPIEVNSSIVPKVTNTKDIGSSTSKFKDGHFQGVLRSNNSIVLTEAGGNNLNNTLTTSQTSFTTDQQLITKKYVDDNASSIVKPSPSKSIAAGINAGATSQGSDAIALGTNAGQSSQGSDSVAIGRSAASSTQGTAGIAVGSNAAGQNQNPYAVAIGYYAGQTTQGSSSVAIGNQSGFNTQGTNSVAVGNIAGNNSQGTYGVAIGYGAAQTSQGGSSVAIGNQAGLNTQGNSSIAIGILAGAANQQGSTVAIGNRAGNNNQGANSVAVGAYAGINNQHPNTVVLNGTGGGFNTDRPNATFVKPIRNANLTHQLRYDLTTGEISYW